jgi:hypothetical protein
MATLLVAGKQRKVTLEKREQVLNAGSDVVCSDIGLIEQRLGGRVFQDSGHP